MDEFSSAQPQPQVFINQTPFFSSFWGKMLKIMVLVVTIIVIAFLAVNYFKASLAPTKAKVTTSFVAPGPDQIPEKLSLTCPVSSELCKKGKSVIFQGSPALLYNLPAGTNILTANNLQNSADYVVLENHNDNLKILYMAAQDQEGCYSITYTIPAGADFDKPSTFPLKSQTGISKAGSETFSVEEERGNLMVMIRKNPIPDANLCTIADNPLREYGPFQAVDKYLAIK